MKKAFASFAVLLITTFQTTLQCVETYTNNYDKKIVTSTKRIYLENFPGAYNPSLIEIDDGYLLTFRHVPSRSEEPWLSYIGIVKLDSSFDPVSDPQILDTRLYNQTTPSQSEDARIFRHDDRLFLIYNDNMDLIFPSPWERRDMHIAELFCDGDSFFLSEPIKLIYEEKYRFSPWQKNWSPFEWNGWLILTYMINPYEVISPDLMTGICKTYTLTQKPILWDYGPIRGGTPAQIVDGEYLAFFHSGSIMKSRSSDNQELWHYFMGAYTFSANPPFEIKRISKEPIDAPGFYTYSSYSKRVIYPGGFVVEGQKAYVAYGKDDSEIWIATIDLERLRKSMDIVK